ncbi:hypothetical protein QBC37DRAFT_456891 [Rhypophila decipiens]|uniref:NACHT domain-containing protein n=1 Tax=Rhypophila decipiens TaxID=261697 RepID=A0AAN6XWP9_9PEZI|nr:hypothetical protein QBC37DRAFT_456891 [Rhypophila decipiens]
MLPEKIAKVPSRVFTYSWNANTFYDASDEPFKSQAETLLRKIHEMRAETKTLGLADYLYCLMFWRSSPGQVLADRSEPSSPQQSILQRTNGILFLGTPLRGSDGVAAAKHRVVVATLLGSTTASDLLLRVLEDKPGDRQELIDAFTTLAMRYQIPLTMFYETETSDITNALKGLSRNVVAGIKRITGIKTEMVLVPRHSACLDGEWTKIPLPVRHVHMNKFRGRRDPNYTAVSNCIKTFLDRLVARKKASTVTEAKLSAIKAQIELMFPDISERYRDIHTTPNDAFAWLSGHRPGSRTVATAANTFNSWLRSEDESSNVFWISGKPGAGKSTFMKYLVESQCIRSAAQSGTLTLFYFFLLVGRPIQRSVEGLLYSLLHQIVVAAIDRKHGIQMLSISDALTGNDMQDAVQKLDSLRESQLEAILLSLLGSLGISRRIHVCIDGLDEFKSDTGPRSILPLINKIKSIPGVRLILSSRPEDEFSNYFKSQPHLRLEDVTADDMFTFADQRLSAGKIERDLRISITEAIVEKAEGIFLWVALVTKTLLADLEAGKPPQSLRDSLEEFPKGMSQLYISIWNRHNKGVAQHQAEAALFFHLLIDSRTILDAIPGLRFRYWLWQTGLSARTLDEDELDHNNVTLFHIAVASDETLARSLLMDGDKVDLNVVLAQCHAVSQALPIRCAGMIDVDIEYRGQAGPDPESRVSFIHRTAHDFFRQTEGGRKILSHVRGLPRPERFRRVVLVSLAKNWAFHSVFNRYGVCYPVFASELHILLTSEGIVKERNTIGELDQLVQLCKRLPRDGNIVHQGLRIRCFLGLDSWILASSHQDQVRLANACMSWRTKSSRSYHELITWLWKYIAPWGYTKVPDNLSAFGPMRISTSQCFAVSLARLAEADGFQQGLGVRVLYTWYRRLQGTAQTRWGDMMYAFAFFSDVSFNNTAFKEEAGHSFLFNRLYPDPHSCYSAKYMILLSFPFESGFRQFEDPLDLKDNDSLARLRIMALGYLSESSNGSQTPSNWRAKAVPLKYWDLLIPMAAEKECRFEQVTKVFKQVLDNPEAKDLGKMQDYLLELGVTYREDGQDKDAAPLGGEQGKKEKRFRFKW